MKSFGTFPCRANDAVVMVSSYRNGELSGWLVHPRLDGPQEIQSVPQLLFLMDDLLLQEERLVSYHAFEPTGCSCFSWRQGEFGAVHATIFNQVTSFAFTINPQISQGFY